MNDYPCLKIIFPEREIFLRLGGHLTKTQMSAEDSGRFRSLALKGFSECRPRGRWEIFKVKMVTETGVMLDDGSFICGGDFARRCGNITHLWCGAVTLGPEVAALRDRADKISESAVFDAVGAECADAAMDLLQELARLELLRQGMTLASRRYSPGYGDMGLEVQQFFFERLHLADMGMSLSETYYMLPEKSVTAFAGVRQEC